MRERAFATIAVWLGIVVAINQLLDTISYIDYVPTEILGPTGERIQSATQVTMLMPGLWQMVVAALIFFLIAGAAAGTMFIWRGANAVEAASNVKANTKSKRDQRERVKRLLETMDDDEIAALESYQNDGERMTLEELVEVKRR